VTILRDDTNPAVPLYSAKFINEAGTVTVSNKKFTAAKFIKNMRGYVEYLDDDSKILFEAMKPKPVSPPSTPPASPKAGVVISARHSAYFSSGQTIFNARSSVASQTASSGRLTTSQEDGLARISSRVGP
jgi:hypothetical protein